MSVAIAALSYHVIEQPARQAAVWKRLGAWLSKRGNVARVGGFAVTALLVAVLSVGQLRGVELLPKPAPATTAPAAWSSPEELAAALAESSAGDSWKPFSAELSGPLQPVDFQGCLRDAVAPGDHSRLREPCVLSGDGGRRTAYVVGDSIALSWVPALRSALGSGWDVAELGLQGCPAASTRVGEVRDRATFTDDCERICASPIWPPSPRRNPI
ncbi:SGNH hydrolase domain-containing protein [Leifsonia xyli]|uniref:SGNH hydrolase domain-containing protein n=1 Tax=Leifsonia xyli TaxID=1575 RepID=UPI0022A98947|nr:SGNH hydrolase domain-containing protein [Leifsonia xyli]